MIRMQKRQQQDRPGTTRDAIRQSKPFRSASQEAFVALLVTAQHLRWPVEELLQRHGGITVQQYNVLRILRGAGPAGLPTLEVAARMIERTPGVTRLIDRLEAKGLVERERSNDDRRLVVCRITKAGLALLADLDDPMDALDDASFSGLSKADLKSLIRLLDRVRAG